MKIRNGFVSNSSSSSFVILGFKLEKGTDIAETIIDEYEQYENGYSEHPQPFSEYKNIEVLTNTEDGAPDDDNIVVGKKVIDVHSDEVLESEVIDFDKIVREVKEFQKEKGIDAPLKMYAGTRMC